MSKPAARVSDMHVCPMATPGVPPIPHVGGPILLPGVPTVFIGGMPAATATNMCTCVGPPDSIIMGSLGVFIGGKPAARLGDPTAHGGTIIAGCPTVLIGDISTPGALLQVDSPCPILAALSNPPETEEEKQKQAELLKQLEQAVYQNLLSVPEGQRADAINTLRDYQQTMDAADMARLSQAAYDPDNEGTPLGFERADLSEIGLNEEFLNDENSGFSASIFRSTTGGEPEYVVAYRGTEGPSGKDWSTNLEQGLGAETDQYDRALIVGDRMENSFGPNGFRTTGHSLGGGLASAASATTGARGTTFNSAGVHPDTTRGINGVSDRQREINEGNTNAYYNSQDPLNRIQDNRGTTLAAVGGGVGGLGGAVGGFFIGGPVGALIGGLGGLALGGLGGYGASKVTDVLPEAYGNRIELPNDAAISIEQHGIEAVIDLLDERALEDLEKLKKYFGC